MGFCSSIRNGEEEAELPIYPMHMNAGDGPHSYRNNSSYQRAVLDVAKSIIEEEIGKNLDINKEELGSAACILQIADFGCSTGHNSFPAMHIIIQSINNKLASSSSSSSSNDPIPEFCVIFNDVVGNDFNTLVSSLPPQRERGYHAYVVAGDFHRRLLPPSSLHLGYSCWSVHWLSQAPAALTVRGSPAWNGGRILWAGDRKEVCDAYLEQFGKDLDLFLKFRAQEMVGGGLMLLIIPGVPASWNPQTEYTIPSDIQLLESCLVHMAKMGKFSEEKIDSFNIPYYFSTPQELKTILHKNKSFCIQRMEIVNNPKKHRLQGVEARAALYRAVHEEMLARHFGSEIIDELFNLYMKKLAASPLLLNSHNDKTILNLIVLKRIMD